MRKREIRIELTVWGWGFIVLWTILGYFVYQDFKNVLAVAALAILYTLTTLLALIPFVGVIVQWLAMEFLVWPLIYQLTQLPPTWLTSLMFWTSLAIGAGTTLIVTAWIISERRS